MTPISLDQLATTLGLGDHEHLSIVGGGGKTTIMHELARRLTGTRVVTTTTKMGSDQNRGLPVLLAPTDAEIEAIDGSAMVWRSIHGSKAIGVSPEDCDRWFGLVDHVVIEADGSRRRPFKAPATFEPVVPSSTTMLISVIGADALGRVIFDQCHRPLRVAALAGCQPSRRLTPELAARVLLHERGFLAARPPGARMAIAITKVDDAVRSAVTELIEALEQLLRSGMSGPAGQPVEIDIVAIATEAMRRIGGGSGAP